MNMSKSEIFMIGIIGLGAILAFKKAEDIVQDVKDAIPEVPSLPGIPSLPSIVVPQIPETQYFEDTYTIRPDPIPGKTQYYDLSDPYFRTTLEVTPGEVPYDPMAVKRLMAELEREFQEQFKKDFPGSVKKAPPKHYPTRKTYHKGGITFISPTAPTEADVAHSITQSARREQRAKAIMEARRRGDKRPVEKILAGG